MKIARFRNGILYDLEPRNPGNSLYEDRQIAYDPDTVIVSDSDTYDPQVPKSIANLHVPKFTADFGALPDVTSNLAYILKIRCGAVEDSALIPFFVSKTLQMMLATRLIVGWTSRDYLQVIRNYYRVGRFYDGDYYEQSFRRLHPQLFADPCAEKANEENEKTKEYFKKKWLKKHN